MLIQHAFPGRQGGPWQRNERVLCFSNHHLAQRENKPIAAVAATGDSITCPQRSGPRIVVKSSSVFACFEQLGEPCSYLKQQNSCAKNRSTPLDRLSEPIPCEVLRYLCL